MSTLINEKAVEQMTLEVLQKDMNDCLDAVTKEVIEKLERTVKANVAARLIAMCNSQYNLQYCRNELLIRVQMETKHV